MPKDRAIIGMRGDVGWPISAPIVTNYNVGTSLRWKTRNEDSTIELQFFNKYKRCWEPVPYLVENEEKES